MVYEIYNDKKEFVNAISADEDYVVNYCKENNYTFSLRDFFEDLDALKMGKIAEIKKDCEKYINNGLDIKFSDDIVKHFTYDLADQNNISEMFIAVMNGASEFPYHANGEICELYTKEQIFKIYYTLALFKTEAITYHNSLKAQIINSEDIDSIKNTEFKVTKLEKEYLDNYNVMMEAVNNQLGTLLSNISMK